MPLCARIWSFAQWVGNDCNEKGESGLCPFIIAWVPFHPEAIPAPYWHSNVNSDEVLYDVEGNFMSRKGVRKGSITLHPSGFPHGPHPVKAEASIGKKGRKNGP